MSGGAAVPAPCGAVVLGNDLAGLETVRSLGRRGIPVTVVAPRCDTHSAFSRYCTGRVVVDLEDDGGQLTALERLADTGGRCGLVLFPTGDEAAALVARNHERLAGRFSLTTPPWHRFRWLYDKRLTYELATRVGVACPVTVPGRAVESFELAGGRFPAIVKPAVKRQWSRRVRERAWRADDGATLEALVVKASRLIDPDHVLVQELVPGNGSAQRSYGVLCDRGRVVASVSARRLRQYPAGFGRSSSFVETVDEPELAELGERVVAATGYTGLLELEFKRDGRDGALRLLDANPRVWTWYALARRAGLDLTYLAWRLALGDDVLPGRAAVGVRWVRVGTDLLAAAGELAGGLTTVGAYLGGLRGPLELATLARDDPLPALAAPLVRAGRLARRAGQVLAMGQAQHSQEASR